MSLELKFLLYNKNFKIKDEEIQWDTFKHMTDIEGHDGPVTKLLGVCETVIELGTEIDEHSQISILETHENIIAISTQFKDTRFCLVFKTLSIDMIYKEFKKEFIDKLSHQIFETFYKFDAKKHEDDEKLFKQFVAYLEKVKLFNSEQPFSVFRAVIGGVPIVSLNSETYLQIENYLENNLVELMTETEVVSLKLFYNDVFIYSFKKPLAIKGQEEIEILGSADEYSEQEDALTASSIYTNNTRLVPTFDKTTFLFYTFCLMAAEETIICVNKKKGSILSLRIKEFNWHIKTKREVTPQKIQQLKSKLDCKVIRDIPINHDLISDVIMTEKMAIILNINFYKKYFGDISFKKYLNFIFRKNYFIDSKLEDEIILYNEQTQNGLICKYIGTIEKYLVVYIHKVDEEEIKKHWLDSLKILFRF